MFDAKFCYFCGLSSTNVFSVSAHDVFFMARDISVKCQLDLQRPFLGDEYIFSSRHQSYSYRKIIKTPDDCFCA